jgi:hypothetical protein
VTFLIFIFSEEVLLQIRTFLNTVLTVTDISKYKFKIHECENFPKYSVILLAFLQFSILWNLIFDISLPDTIRCGIAYMRSEFVYFWSRRDENSLTQYDWNSKRIVLAARHPIDVRGILYAACTEIASWWWNCWFEIFRGKFNWHKLMRQMWLVFSRYSIALFDVIILTVEE